MPAARHRRILIPAVAAASLLVLGACRVAPSSPPTPLTLQLAWTHQAQFAGLYTAEQDGIFAAAGLDVTILEGGPTVDNLGSVLDGTADFGVAGADQLLIARSQGKLVRALAVIYRRSPIVFVSAAERGLTRPHDFPGLRIRTTANISPSLRAMMANIGRGPESYTEVNLPSDLALFASGEADVWGAYLDGFALTLRDAGYELNIVYPDDYGVHFYADTLFTTDTLIAESPDLVQRFVHAALQGWIVAVEDPPRAAALVQVYRPEADPALESRRMNALIPLVNTGEDQIGWMRPEVWTSMEAILREQGILSAAVAPSELYTMDFVERFYER